MVKSSHIKYSWSPEEKQKEWAEEILEKIMTEHFLKLMKEDLNSLILEAQ